MFSSIQMNKKVANLFWVIRCVLSCWASITQNKTHTHTHNRHLLREKRLYSECVNLNICRWLKQPNMIKMYIMKYEVQLHMLLWVWAIHLTRIHHFHSVFLFRFSLSLSYIEKCLVYMLICWHYQAIELL